MDLPSSEILLFESHDYVRDRYQQRHGRELSAEKAGEIVAAFSQGRQYFEAARSAGALAEPVLTYYGVNALTRGAVLFLNPRLRQSSLKPAHGLTPVDWQQVLAGGLARVSDLSVAVSAGGTFPEYCSASGNRSWIIFRDLLTFRRAELPGSPEVPSGTRITLKAILARVPDLNEMYEEVMLESPAIFAASFQPVGHQLTIYGSKRFRPDGAAIVSVLPELADAHIADVSTDAARPALAFTLPVLPDKGMNVPPLRYAFGGMWLTLPFDGGWVLSTVSVLYLLSFVTSTLSRYYPREWLMLLGSQRGDRVYPLLRRGQDLLTQRYAAELAGELST